MVKKKLLLIRLDKIGDLVCTLPVDQIESLSDYETHWVISKGLGFVLDHSRFPRKYTELDKSSPVEAMKKLGELIAEFKPDIGINFQGPWWVSFYLWKFKVPLRIGPKSQWHSFLFLNKTLRQRRSEASQHEVDYNFDLLKLALGERIESPPPFLELEPSTTSSLLDHFEIKSKAYYIVHPGMAGSALNWSIKNYVELINKILSQKEDQIVITGTQIDEPWIAPLRKQFAANKRVHILQNKLSASELIVVLSYSKAVIAPSTGVLHLAASLGVKTVGIFSPIQVQRKIRWGARGPDVSLVDPPVKCPEKFLCSQEKCTFYNCMDLIKVEDIYQLLDKN